MKKYVLFAGSEYYPSGGLNDLVDSYDTIEEAEAKARVGYVEYTGAPYISEYDWADIVDRDTWKSVKDLNLQAERRAAYVKTHPNGPFYTGVGSCA